MNEALLTGLTRFSWATIYVMESFFNSLGPLGYVYLVCAAFGGVLFIARFVLQFMGGGDDLNASDLTEHHDSDIGFEILSLQGLSTFFLMFGVVGLALQDAILYISLSGAIWAGMGSVWLIRLLFQFMVRLQSSGTLNLQNAVGQEGRVYLTISPEQSGQVQVAVQNRLLTLDAVAESPKIRIETGCPIVVVALQKNNTLVVRPL